MAQKVSVTYACDYDHKEIPPGQHRVRRFSFDGRDYEMDLCTWHSDSLDETIGRLAQYARKPAARAPVVKRRTAAHRQHSASVRAWAKNMGIEVSDRGRIPAAVVARYEAAHRFGSGDSWSAALIRLVRRVGFVERPGGATYRISPLNAVFFDNHQSWYALHWTTPLRPEDVVDLCHEYLGLRSRTRALVQSTGAEIVETSLAAIRKGQLSVEDTKLLRIDTRGFVIIWESSGEYERMRAEREHVPHTAIFGFGSNRINPELWGLMQRTATEGVVGVSESIWRELHPGAGEDFKYSVTGRHYSVIGRLGGYTKDA